MSGCSAILQHERRRKGVCSRISTEEISALDMSHTGSRSSSARLGYQTTSIFIASVIRAPRGWCKTGFQFTPSRNCLGIRVLALLKFIATLKPRDYFNQWKKYRLGPRNHDFSIQAMLLFLPFICQAFFVFSEVLAVK